MLGYICHGRVAVKFTENNSSSRREIVKETKQYLTVLELIENKSMLNKDNTNTYTCLLSFSPAK